MKIEHHTVMKHTISDIPLGVGPEDLAGKLYSLGQGQKMRLTGLVKDCEARTFDLEFEEVS